MKLKKIASLMMALIMIAALAVPAFASAVTEFGTASNKTEQSVTVKAVTQEPTISIAMPSINTNPVIVNPYGIKWSGDLNGLTATTDAVNQVISGVLNVENKTNVKLKVDVTVTTTLGGNMTLSATDLANGKTDAAEVAEELGKITKNQAYVYVVFKDNGTTKGTAIPAKVEADTSAGTTANYIVLKAGASTVKDLLTLGAASDTAPQYLTFGFNGNAATKPTTGWTNKDTITAAVAFTFTPVV